MILTVGLHICTCVCTFILRLWELRFTLRVMHFSNDTLGLIWNPELQSLATEVRTQLLRTWQGARRNGKGFVILKSKEKNVRKPWADLLCEEGKVGRLAAPLSLCMIL